MAMREPAFWWREVGFAARMLAPLAAIYGVVAGLRLKRRGRRAGVPVVGIGNGKVIPAGPLRAPLGAQLARAHALVVIGTSLGAADVAADARARNLPVFHARLEPDAGFVAALGGGRVLAFAGIGDPEKFFATLSDAGVAVAATRSFPDHHRFTPDEARALCEDADREGLILVTTEKDLARLAGDEDVAEL